MIAFEPQYSAGFSSCMVTGFACYKDCIEISMHIKRIEIVIYTIV
jgi:hypothetical protein